MSLVMASNVDNNMESTMDIAFVNNHITLVTIIDSAKLYLICVCKCISFRIRRATHTAKLEIAKRH